MKVNSQQYLDIHKDVKQAGMDPLFHYLSWGQAEHRQVDLPELPSDWNWQWYLGAYKDLRDKGLSTQAQAEAHYLKYGWKEDRWPIKVTPVPPVPPTPPGPYPPGLSTVYESSDPNEAFCALDVPDGLLIGRYGLYTGGADILLNGKVEKRFDNPVQESIFMMIQPRGGNPLAISEEYASVFERVAPGDWRTRYARPEWETLMLDIKEAPDGTIWALWVKPGGNISGTILSSDKGRSWDDYRTYPGMQFKAIGIDGDTIRLAGANSTGQLVADIDGNTIFTFPNMKEGYSYWPIIGKDGLWSVGTWNNRREPNFQPRFGYIDFIEGTNRTGYYGGVDFPYCMAMLLYKGIRYALFTHDWDRDPVGSMLVSSGNGRDWEPVLTLPHHIISLCPGSQGIYLCGGKYRERPYVGHLTV